MGFELGFKVNDLQKDLDKEFNINYDKERAYDALMQSRDLLGTINRTEEEDYQNFLKAVNPLIRDRDYILHKNHENPFEKEVDYANADLNIAKKILFSRDSDLEKYKKSNPEFFDKNTNDLGEFWKEMRDHYKVIKNTNKESYDKELNSLNNLFTRIKDETNFIDKVSGKEYDFIDKVNSDSDYSNGLSALLQMSKNGIDVNGFSILDRVDKMSNKRGALVLKEMLDNSKNFGNLKDIIKDDAKKLVIEQLFGMDADKTIRTFYSMSKAIKDYRDKYGSTLKDPSRMLKFVKGKDKDKKEYLLDVYVPSINEIQEFEVERQKRLEQEFLEAYNKVQKQNGREIANSIYRENWLNQLMNSYFKPNA